MTKRLRPCRAFAAAAVYLLLIACLYSCIASVAFDVSFYDQTPPFDAMAEEIVSYLSGKLPALSQTLFGEQERLHMADVLGLFRTGKTVALGALALGILFLARALFARGDAHAFATGFAMGFALFALPFLAMGVFAAVDFTAWFTAMHRLVFRNELWLFDGSSPLIQMMPESFFAGAVGRICARFAVCAAVLCALFWLLPSTVARLKKG